MSSIDVFFVFMIGPSSIVCLAAISFNALKGYLVWRSQAPLGVWTAVESPAARRGGTVRDGDGFVVPCAVLCRAL